MEKNVAANLNSAIDFCDRVIETDPEFCEQAYYYKALFLRKRDPKNLQFSTRRVIASCLKKANGMISDRINSLV